MAALRLRVNSHSELIGLLKMYVRVCLPEPNSKANCSNTVIMARASDSSV